MTTQGETGEVVAQRDAAWWDDRYVRDNLPWEDHASAPVVARLCAPHLRPGQTVTDLGCGLGTDARFLAQEYGVHVTAVDLSSAAIERARELGEGPIGAGSVRFVCGDFSVGEPVCPPAEVVFDRGLLHNAATGEELVAWAQGFARHVQPGGLWLNVSGDIDDDHPERGDAHPGLTLFELSGAIEEQFRILSVARDVFGIRPGRSDFPCWAVVAQRRSAPPDWERDGVSKLTTRP